MSTPTVSVVMLTYNRPQLIGRAIESVMAQTLTDWELVIVQDGANPHTIQVVGEWTARDPRVKHLRRDKGGNIANATNYGLRAAQGKYIAILDDDDAWITKDKLEKQVRFLEEHPEYVGCGGGMITIDENGKETLRYLKPETDDDIRKNALFANPMTHSTGMYRRSAIQEIGLYDETLAGFQDWDVWLKLGRLGKLYNFPEHVCYYQMWEGSGSFQAPLGNTTSALRIVRRHRDIYRGFPVALSMAYAYHAYAHLPVWVRKSNYSFLSRLKKSLFTGSRK